MIACAAGRDHAALKVDDTAWRTLAFVGIQQTYSRTRPPLELRNCRCGSTLAREVRS